MVWFRIILGRIIDHYYFIYFTFIAFDTRRERNRVKIKFIQGDTIIGMD